MHLCRKKCQPSFSSAGLELGLSDSWNYQIRTGKLCGICLDSVLEISYNRGDHPSLPLRVKRISHPTLAQSLPSDAPSPSTGAIPLKPTRVNIIGMDSLSWQGSIPIVVVLLGSLVFYRLFLHPLAGYPGPKLAAITRWYEGYYDVIQNGQYTFKIKELHQKYGESHRLSVLRSQFPT